ncbi:Rv1733c family protein [Streptomyces sp. TP-A0874]|uniref:Rv1733c family protein n=1 Tax=Streptomyces sp. TP-A0874 TaxID=549819 RepID=UPI0008530C5F|nr:hypothetical protein [Streptomyces sp. TP-A0874]
MLVLQGLWRWRRNPLRRCTDLVEAWIALVAVLLVLLGAPAAGVIAGSLAHASLRQTAREQQHQRHLVRATVEQLLPHPPADPDPESASVQDSHRQVLATWTATDGTMRSGVAPAPLSARPGQPFTFWADAAGRPTRRPMDETAATAHAVLAGVGVGVGVLGLVEGARRLVVCRLQRRRYRSWERDWRRTGPDWGRTGADS